MWNEIDWESRREYSFFYASVGCASKRKNKGGKIHPFERLFEGGSVQSIKKKGKARHCGGMNVPRIEDRGLRNSKLDFHPSFARSENFTRSFFFFIHRYIYSSIELCSKSFFLFFNSFVTSIERIIQSSYFIFKKKRRRRNWKQTLFPSS